MRAVAITAVGVVCGLGQGVAEFSDAIRKDRCGIRGFDDPAWRALAGGVALCDGIPDLAEYPDDRKIALLARVADQVIGDGIGDPKRCGVYLGTGLSSVTPRELGEDVYPHRNGNALDSEGMTLDLARDRVAPLRHQPSRAAAWLAQRVGAQGPQITVFSACAAGAEAIAAGARAVARGELDVAFAGGQDAMAHPIGLASFGVLGALSMGVARPFDRRRDGFALGEGAALLRIEPLEACARPLAVFLGAGSSLDAFGVTAPHPEGEGAEAAMRRALRDAGLPSEAVEWVKAHATGTPVGDIAESKAIRRLFGSKIPVNSFKGALGHTLAAAGAVEAVAVVLGISGGFLPGTVGCEQPDAMDIDVVQQARIRPVGVALANSFGFGGQNVSLVFRHPDAG